MKCMRLQRMHILFQTAEQTHVKTRIRRIRVLKRFYTEREGFEPPEPCGSTVFKTAAIDHSATSP